MTELTLPMASRDGAPAPASLAEAGKATPMMVLYMALKAEHPDGLLFYRMGDFYEMFFDDAVAAAAALDIALTRRGKHLGADIPMCGVPVHSADSYLTRLIAKGFKVVVCEQTEDPAEARQRGGAKSLVARDVVRIVTAGTITEDALLDARRHNYLAALAEAQGALALAWLDMSTGDFQVQPVTAQGLSSVLARLEPGELLLAERLGERPDLVEALRDRGAMLTPLPASRFDSTNGEHRLKLLYSVQALDGFGDFSRAELAACARRAGGRGWCWSGGVGASRRRPRYGLGLLPCSAAPRAWRRRDRRGGRCARQTRGIRRRSRHWRPHCPCQQ